MKNIIAFIAIFSILSGCNSSLENRNSDIQIKKVIRKGSVIMVKPEKLEFYKELHANPWEGVDGMLKECNIQNYSIYYRDGFLFSYLEYTGDNWAEDMKKMAGDSTTQAWWKLTDPCQEPISSAKEGEWWAEMEEVYHLD